MRMSSSLLVSSGTAMGLTAIAIAVILLASNFTIINAQQQQLTSQTGQTENGATTVTTTPFQSTNDSFRVQVPQGWVIQDVNNTGSALLEETRTGYALLAQLCLEEQQGGAAALPNVSGSGDTVSCQGSENDVIHIVRYPDLDTRLQAANNVTANNNMTTTDNILSYQLQKLADCKQYRCNIKSYKSTDRRNNSNSASPVCRNDIRH